MVWVNGIRIETVAGLNYPSDPLVVVGVSGEGFEASLTGPLGQVVEIPGWGLLTVEQLDGDPPTVGGGRPPTILHFRAVTDFPLEFTSVFPLDSDGSMVLTSLNVKVHQAGIAGERVASLTVSPWSGGELEVEGPAGTVVEVPDWGTITIVEPEAGEAGDGPRAPLRIQTLTDFPVVDESQT